MTKAVNLLLDKFMTRFGKYPDVAELDEGKEFYNVGVRDLLKSHSVLLHEIRHKSRHCRKIQQNPENHNVEILLQQGDLQLG